VRRVYIYHPRKLAVRAQKLVVRPVECGTSKPVHRTSCGTSAAQLCKTSPITTRKNTITFHCELWFRWYWTFGKLIQRAISPNQEQAPNKQVKVFMLCHVFLSSYHSRFIHLLVWVLETCLTIHIASYLIVWHTYTQDKKRYIYFNYLSLQYLHTPFLYEYIFIRVCKHLCIIPLSISLESFQHMWVLFMASSHFPIWHNNNLILHTIWLRIARLVRRLNASTLFFTLAMVPWSPSHRLPFTFA